MKNVCDCNKKHNDIFTCYMNNLSSKPLSNEELNSILDIYSKLLENEELNNVLKFYFDTVKNQMITDNKTSSLIFNMSDKEIIELIKENLPIRDKEKKELGEVFTPYELINEMLDKLPEEIWSNPNLKWLDPANGIGNFPMVVYKRLMIGLKEIRGLEEELHRHNHILKNMLYMVELNPRNVEISKRIFGEEANIYCGDFLKEEWKEEFGLKEFDIVVGNPPFQIESASGDNKLYLDFTKISIKMLKENGYLLFITPRNILEYLITQDKKRKYVDKFYQINFISIETANKYFTVSSTFTWFLLKKNIYTDNTIIEYKNIENNLEKINIKLYKGYRLPKYLSEIDLQIISKITTNNEDELYKLNNFYFNNKVQRIRKEHIGKQVFNKKTDKHNIIIIDTINKSNPLPGKFYYFDKKDNDFNIDKLILSKKGYVMPFIDNYKKYTYSDNFNYIKNENLELVLNLINSNIFKYLLVQYSKNGFDNINIFKILKKIKNNNRIDIYKYYKLTENEIEHINKIVN